MSVGKIIYTSLLLMGLFPFLCGCHKYIDDENISFKSTKNRITDGVWYIDAFFINYQDSSLHVYDSGSSHPGYFLKSLELIFTTTKSNSVNGAARNEGPYFIEDGPDNIISIGNPSNRTASGSWELNSNKSSIGLYSNTPLLYRIPFQPNQTPWEILKLTKSDFRIKTEYNKKVYEIYFKKQ